MSPLNGEPRSVLLVDDEDGIRRVLAITLADKGYEVRQAKNAEEALAGMRQRPAPVVLTDIKMPGMDGLGLLKAIKNMAPDTEVVLVTGHGDLDLAIQGIKLDATDFITKPISDDALDIALARAWERRGMRRAIREHTEGLERLVEVKTRELVAAERLAAVGQAVAELSHAVKNMASGLEGSLFLLRQGQEKDQREYLQQGWEMLESNVRRLKELSLDMLRFARAEELHPAPVDPVLPARQVAELLSAKAAAAGVAIALDAPASLPPALLDAAALHRCLLDLAGNALDACAAAGFGPPPSGRPGGRVTLRVEALPGGGTAYSVADNGCGIPEADLPRLFTPFRSTKGEHGSGLGLMTTKKTVEAHGGSIHVTSKYQSGTECIILIPATCDNKVVA